VVAVFVLIARYLRPAEEVDRHLDGHRAWIVQHFEEGRFLLTARQVPLTGGLILASASGEAELRAAVAEDPFVVNGVAEYEILEFTPVRAAAGLESLLPAPGD
jgi:uncharacterized protein YciI